MNQGARIGIIAGLIVALVVLFMVFKPKDKGSEPAPATATEVAVADDTHDDGSEHVDGDEHADDDGMNHDNGMNHDDGDHMHTLIVEDGVVTGQTVISVPKGTEVMLEIKADVTDEVHVHGYELHADVAPGDPAMLTFTADATGTFEVELESSGLLLTEVEVTP